MPVLPNLSGWRRHVRVCNEASPCFWCRCCGCFLCCCSCWISVQHGGTIALKRGWRFSNCVRVCSVDRTPVVNGWSMSNGIDDDAENKQCSRLPMTNTVTKTKCHIKSFFGFISETPTCWKKSQFHIHSRVFNMQFYAQNVQLKKTCAVLCNNKI